MDRGLIWVMSPSKPHLRQTLVIGVAGSRATVSPEQFASAFPTRDNGSTRLYSTGLLLRAGAGVRAWICGVR